MKKTIKRNNIKVPAYDGGTPGVGGSAAGNGLSAAQVGAIGQGAVAAGGMLANSLFGTSTATTSSQVAAQTAGDIFGGIGKGASIGAAFGPWGAAIGGAAGAVLGAIGQKGREAEMTSFTDYDLGTRPTGLMGAFGANSRLKRERNRIKSNAYANRAAVEGTENLAYEFAQKNKMGGVNSFKDGGQVKKPVYMSSPYDFMGGGQEIATDTKEVGYNPQTGEIKINPKYGKEGSDLIHRIAQPGEYWFGKLVNPETGNTFKEDARSIIKKSEVKGTRAKFQDKRTAKINNENRLEQLDALADAQNRVHQEQNTKPKVKRSVLAGANGMQVPAYEDGKTDTLYYYIDENGNLQTTTTPEKRTIGAPNKYTTVNPVENGLKWDYRLGWITDYGREARIARENKITEKTLNRVGRGNLTKQEYEQLVADQQNELMNLFITDEKLHTISPEFRNMILGRNKKPFIGDYRQFDNLGLFNGYWPTFNTSVEAPVEETQAPVVAANVKANTKPTITEEELAANKKAAERPEVKALTEAQHNMILNGLQQGIKTPDLYIPTSISNESLKKMSIASPQKEELEKAPKDYSWIGDLAGTIGQLAVAIPGLGAKPEIEDAVYNPYHRTIMNSMRNRRARLVEGAMADNARERAIGNYNLTRTGANTGRNLAAMTQSAVNAADAIAKVRLQEDNANNQYRGEEAEMLNNLGQQWVNATNLARTNNAQNRAAALMTNDAARKSIHNILAGSTKSYNTKLRDKQLLPLYAEFLKSGFARDLVDNITV